MSSPVPHPVGVRTLGEFVFCPRAGLLAARREADEEPEYDEPRLDFMPQYSLAAVEEQLAVWLSRFGRWSAGGAVLIVAGVTSVVLGVKAVAAISAVALFVLGRFWVRELAVVMRLADVRRQALQASPKEPPADASSATPVTWWELLKAGFDSVRLQEPLRDEQTGLVGSPWRVLRKGSLRIPVIKLESAHFDSGRFWIYPQHEIRLAAYARLLEACERGESPYGVVLFGDRFEGVAVPVGKELREAVETTLPRFREALRKSATEAPPPEPPDPALCAGCPLGFPKAATEAERRSVVKKIHGVQGNDGKLYHSECGDGFAWRPPHRRARQKGLLPPGE
ncbi:MAG: hypothetical protein K2X38_23090 [Gemmataceae bacterium]|nr:hypothetical protein [Gemmataceae bacterium]